MREDIVGGSAKLSLETGQDDEPAPGGGAEKSPPQELTDDEKRKAAIAAEKRTELGLFTQRHFVLITNLIYRAANGGLTRDEAVEAFQDLMLSLCRKIRDTPEEIKNIFAYVYQAALYRGADTVRRKASREKKEKCNDLAVQAAANSLDDNATEREERQTKLKMLSAIDDWLDTLEGDEALVAKCRYRDPERTIRETVDIVGKSKATITRILKRIQKKAELHFSHIRN